MLEPAGNIYLLVEHLSILVYMPTRDKRQKKTYWLILREPIKSRKWNDDLLRFPTIKKFRYDLSMWNASFRINTVRRRGNILSSSQAPSIVDFVA